MRRPGLVVGGLVGLSSVAPLVALLYLANRLLELPFAPFGLFEALTRALPGAWVTRGIEALVAALSGLGLSLRAAARTAEEVLAVAVFVGATLGLALALFRLQRWHQERWPAASRARLAAGAVVGAAVGAALAPGCLRSCQAPVAGVTWLALVFVLWGLALVWLQERLLRGRQSPAGEVPVRARATLERRDRRRFLLRLGGVSASVTVAGAVLAATLQRGARSPPCPRRTRPSPSTRTRPAPRRARGPS